MLCTLRHKGRRDRAIVQQSSIVRLVPSLATTCTNFRRELCAIVHHFCITQATSYREGTPTIQATVLANGVHANMPMHVTHMKGNTISLVGEYGSVGTSPIPAAYIGSWYNRPAHVNHAHTHT